MEKLYTTKEVADMWRLNLRIVQNWCASGKLRAFKAGKDYRISEESLKEFQDANSNVNAS